MASWYTYNNLFFAVLLFLIQCHLNGMSINDVPKFLLENPTMNDHMVIVPLDIDDLPLSFPLMLQGGTSYFPV